MDRKLPALVLALALTACAQGADPMGPEAAAPEVDRVAVPGVFLEENGGMFGNGNRDGTLEAAADDNGGTGGRDSAEVRVLENGGTPGAGGRSDGDGLTTASNGGMFGNGN